MTRIPSIVETTVPVATTAKTAFKSYVNSNVN
jgi:hypothetical protein